MSDINDRIEIELPFSGFYETWHDQKITEAIEAPYRYDRETESDREPTEAEEDALFMADIDWKATRVEYCREYVETFGDEFGLGGLEYSGLQSPAYYNFSTDRVFATIDRDEFNRKVRRVVEAYEEWPEVVHERFTSYDGFSSNYSNDANDEEWTAEDLDACQYRVMLEAWLHHEHDWDEHNDYEREVWLAEDINPYEFTSVNDAIAVVDKYLEDNHKENK